MNAPFAQTDRMGRLTVVLGKDVLNLLRMDVEEHVNDLFTIRIEALAETDDLEFDDLIGTHATVHLKSTDQSETPFDGIITSVELQGQADNGWRYGLILRPWIWLMGLRRKQQIYHQMKVVDILNEVFAPYGKDVENLLTGDFPVLEYTVQYGETDLAFATRLMERFGISYHFAHKDGSHDLVLTDSVSVHQPVPGGSRKFIQADNKRANEEHFWEMKPSQRLTTGKIRLTDYNFKTPDAAMETDRTGDAPYAQGQIESYTYPGQYLDQQDGKGVARLRLDQHRGQDPRQRAAGDCVSLRAGLTVKITNDKVRKVDESLCLSARHSYSAGGYASGGDNQGEDSYSGEYLLMPADTPLRPELKTPRAIVQGPQTARVVGEGEIDCDEYGRILVRFHWDLEDRFSMRCRVSQNWAGKGWGGMVIPRIGMEVVVEFLEGDPDKPLVTGCVYNGKNDVPYPLPEHKTRSTFKTDTHTGPGFNELRFEDKKDEEEIFVHAQKDLNSKIEHNQSERVNKNKVENVGHNKASEIENNFFQVVDGDMELRVGPGNLGAFAPNGADKETQGIRAVPMMLGEPGMRDGIGNLSISVEKTKAQVIGENHTEDVERDKDTKVGGDYDVRVAKSIRIEAGDEIELICGKSRITLSSNGTVAINGQKIMETADSLISLKSAKVELN